ncbi:MAG: hypothetical protein M3022_07045 [Actinomycetota bacterium]|nr:hypothetical protein [Actinomycetota bacterium]
MKTLPVNRHARKAWSIWLDPPPLRVPAAPHGAKAKVLTRPQAVDPKIASKFTRGARGAETRFVVRAGCGVQRQTQRVPKFRRDTTLCVSHGDGTQPDWIQVAGRTRDFF